MNFIFINTQEITALMELPLTQRVAYLMAIRPYMDRQTCVVGIKRRISYQSIREVLYVAPIAGVKTGSPSIQQIRRVVKSLERAGLISIQSTEKHLILKCLLAGTDNSVQNKAGMRPTPQVDMKQDDFNHLKLNSYDLINNQADTIKILQADIPHNSDNNIVFLSKKFEKFWSTYPQPQNKQIAWEAFKRLDPDDALFTHMMTALHAQLTHYEQSQKAGHWLPSWKYPANWLTQQSWNDALITYTTQETTHATHKRHPTKKSSVDILWESCKDGADYSFTDEEKPSTSQNNVITFPSSGKHR